MGNINLYLIRHGIAADRNDYGNDADRPLTKEGKDKTRRVAKRLQELEINFNLILTSPLTRAKQTADLLIEHHLSPKLEIFSPLAPSGDIHQWIEWLQQWQSSQPTSLALIGHQPDLANWAETLLWGKSNEVLVLKKAGIIGLNIPAQGSPIGQSLLFWLTAPRFLL